MVTWSHVSEDFSEEEIRFSVARSARSSPAYSRWTKPHVNFKFNGRTVPLDSNPSPRILLISHYSPVRLSSSLAVRSLSQQQTSYTAQVRC